MDSLKKLIGQTIREVRMNDDNTEISFVTHGGQIHSCLSVGDCCSSSWFHAISGIDNLIGQKVLEVTEKAERDATDEEYKEGNYDWLRIYGITIKTTKGYFDIEFRNDSNGYYGGYLEDTFPSSEQLGRMDIVEKDFDNIRTK